MKQITDECVSCGLPCLGNSCPNVNVVRWYCDDCGDEVEPEELYVTEDDEELCQDCLLNRFKTVKQKINEGGYNDD
jgi:hypothetical protein